MGYNQWISTKIEPKNLDVEISESKVTWGKFYTGGNKDDEIENVSGMIIRAGKADWVDACGRLWSPSGTSGFFVLRVHGDLQGPEIGKFTWDIRYPAGTNSTFRFEQSDFDYKVEVEGHAKAHTVGKVYLRIRK